MGDNEQSHADVIAANTEKPQDDRDSNVDSDSKTAQNYAASGGRSPINPDGPAEDVRAEMDN